MLRVTSDPSLLGQKSRKSWSDSSKSCQYYDVMIAAILVMVEFDKHCPKGTDGFVYFYTLASTQETWCQWLSGRKTGDGLYATRLAQLFRILVQTRRACKNGSGTANPNRSNWSTPAIRIFRFRMGFSLAIPTREGQAHRRPSLATFYSNVVGFPVNPADSESV